jgi:hypothetical protein
MLYGWSRLLSRVRVKLSICAIGCLSWISNRQVEGSRVGGFPDLSGLPVAKKEGGLAVLRYVGSCRNDGSGLRPEQVVVMLEHVAQADFQLLHIHRSGLVLLP